MGESTKAICALLLIVGTITALIAWTEDQPGAMAWILRIGSPVAILALALIFRLRNALTAVGGIALIVFAFCEVPMSIPVAWWLYVFVAAVFALGLIHRDPMRNQILGLVPLSVVF